MSNSYGLRDRNNIRIPIRYSSAESLAQNAGPGRDSARRQRAGKKDAITKRINQIHEIIEQGGSRTKLRSLEGHLQRLINEAYACHECLMGHLDSNDEEFSDTWVEELSLNVDTCIADINEYIEERLGDPHPVCPHWGLCRGGLISFLVPPLTVKVCQGK